MFSKLKNSIKKFKKWIISFLLGGTALAAGLGAIDNQIVIPTSVNIDGKEIIMKWTDNNTNEDFLIRSDSEIYYNFGTAKIIYSITNLSKFDQNVSSVFSFPDNSWDVLKIDQIVNNTTEIVSGYTILSSTSSSITIPQQTKVITQRNNKLLKVFSKNNPKRKLVNFTKSETNEDLILKGETKFYEAIISFPKLEKRGEFFIEAFGSLEGYGHLDPGVGILDQSYDKVNYDNEFSLRASSVSDVEYAQGFIPSITDTIESVNLLLKKAGTPTGNMWLRIETDNAGVPSGTQVGGNSNNLDVSTITTENPPTTWTLFTWTTNKPNLTNGTQYWIIMAADYSFSGTNNVRPYGDVSAPAYSSGTGADYDTSWTAQSGWDFVFEEYRTGTSTATGEDYIINFE